MYVLPEPPAGNKKLGLFLLLSSWPCPRPKEIQVSYLFPQPWLLSFILQVYQHFFICSSQSTLLHPGYCLGCWPVQHHRIPSCLLQTPCFKPCPKSWRSVRSGILFPWLPPCKVTLGWLCPLTEGNCCWQGGDYIDYKVCHPPELITPSVASLFRPCGSDSSTTVPSHLPSVIHFFVNISL